MDQPATVPRHAAARVAALVALATLLVQAAWILALPPFRGIDEFDHAYRAAAVARGEWLPSSQTVTDGRGRYEVVPGSLVKAATPVCQSYAYTGPANCVGTTRYADGPDKGMVKVASGAALYNPAYYLLIGVPASWFDGATSLYVMRIVSALLGALLVAMAAYALRLRAATSWPLLGGVLAMTPMFVYSQSLGAPNGVEMAAGLTLWAALLAQRRADALSSRDELRLLWFAVVAACVLVTVRSLGGMWLMLVLLSCLVVVGRERVTDLVRRHRGTAVVGSLVVVASGVAAVAWNVVAKPNAVNGEADQHLTGALPHTLAEIPLWVLQAIAAFPLRNQPAPMVVYAAALSLFAILLGHAVMRATSRQRALLVTAVVVWLGAQTAIGLATYSHLGTIWQGRYGLPYGVGIPVLAMLALDERRERSLPVPALAGVGAGLLITHAVSILNVEHDEKATSPLRHSSEWVSAPGWVLVALVVAAVLVYLRVLTQPTPRSSTAAEQHHETAGAGR